jgi:hypothetical protein
MIDDKTSFSAVSLALVWIYPTLHLHTCLPPVLHPLSARTEVPHRRRRRLNPSLLPIPLEKVFEKFLDIKNFPWKVQKGREKGFFFKVFFSPALLIIRMNDYFRLFTRLRRIRS